MLDNDGRVLVSSRPEIIGTIFTGKRPDIGSSQRDSVRVLLLARNEHEPVFEVWKPFRLQGMSGHMKMMSRWMQNMGMMQGLFSGDLAIVVGLSPEDFYAARAEDTRRAIGSGVILIILAFASTFFAVVIQKYYATNKALKTAESFIRHVIESMGHGLIALDPAGRVVTLNRKACQLLQTRQNAVRGRHFREILQQIQCSADLSEVLHEDWLEKKVRCSAAGHAPVPLSLSSSRIHDEEGNILGTVILMRDLQEIEALEERVERSERLASLGQMAAGIAHEVRNPLGSIRGLAQYFARKFEQAPEEKKYAEAIIGETDRLNRVIGDLLDFARPQEPNYQTCIMTAIIDHALELVRADLIAKQIRIQRRGEENLPELEADLDLLSQAFMNLFLNAVEAMDAEGTLSIRARLLKPPERLQIEVQDTGHGIPPENIAKVFDPFFTSKKSGTGLGLALVHRIIENHGGSIEVTSIPGKGTTFTINLPIKP